MVEREVFDYFSVVYKNGPGVNNDKTTAYGYNIVYD
jgi:hypothetical protein